MQELFLLLITSCGNHQCVVNFERQILTRSQIKLKIKDVCDGKSNIHVDIYKLTETEVQERQSMDCSNNPNSNQFFDPKDRKIRTEIK